MGWTDGKVCGARTRPHSYLRGGGVVVFMWVSCTFPWCFVDGGDLSILCGCLDECLSALLVSLTLYVSV